MRLNPLLSILLGIAFLPLFTAKSHAVLLDCVSKILSDSIGSDADDTGYGDKINLNLYKDADTILSLSDGTKGYHFQIGELLAEKFPGKKITITDLYWDRIIGHPEKNTVIGNLTRTFLDNSSSKPFPFKDNSFDSIIMRAGICQCFPCGSVCGGFQWEGKQAEHFFSEVIRVLNKKKGTARAYLHGQGKWYEKEIIKHWKQIFQKLEKKYRVKVTLHLSYVRRSDGKLRKLKNPQLNSITIQPR